MNVPLLLGLVLAAAAWVVAVLLRRRRTRYLVANRTMVIEQSLKRARNKQRGCDGSAAEPPGGGKAE